MLKKVCSEYEKRRLRWAVAGGRAEVWEKKKPSEEGFYNAGGHPGGLKDESLGLNSTVSC